MERWVFGEVEFAGFKISWLGFEPGERVWSGVTKVWGQISGSGLRVGFEAGFEGRVQDQHFLVDSGG